MPGVDTVHDLRVAGLADAGDAAVVDADVGLHDPEHRVDDQDVRDHEVQRALGRGDEPFVGQAVAQRLASAEHALVAVHEQVVLDLGPQVGVAEPDAVAGRRAEQLGVARRDIARPIRRSVRGGSRRGPRARARRSASSKVRAVGQPVEPDAPRASRRRLDERRPRASSPGSKRIAVPDGMSRCMPKARGAVEAQRPVDLEEVEVRPDLHGAIAGVRDRHGGGLAPRVELDVALGGRHLARGRRLDGLRARADRRSGRSRASARRRRTPRPAACPSASHPGQHVVRREDARAERPISATDAAVARGLARPRRRSARRPRDSSVPVRPAALARQLGGQEQQQPVISFGVRCMGHP